jgi:N-acetyl-anhydromuramyl-L-alanine amidase AmpD
MKELDLKAIVQYAFPESQYFKEQHAKTQIFLHHTAGNPSASGVFDFWKTNGERIATCVVVAGKSSNTVDGQIVQGFSSKFWAYHLGLKQDTFTKNGMAYKPLDKTSIGVEICNWGHVTKTARGWETYVGTLVPESEVVEYAEPFRGHSHYQRYTDAQIESVRQLLAYWGKTYGIPVKYKGIEIFGVDKRALSGEAGVYTHCSVRYDKSDIHPQPEMLQMLQSL